MIDLTFTIRQLRANAQAMRAFLETVPEEQAQWKPGAETWSLKETMEHIYNEERGDFRRHLGEMFHVPPLEWGSAEPKGWVKIETCAWGLEAFLGEREASLAWLAGLKDPDWEITFQAPWGPIKAGDVLVSWVEHDFLHLRQLNEIHHAWNVEQGKPYSVEYGGGW